MATDSDDNSDTGASFTKLPVSEELRLQIAALVAARVRAEANVADAPANQPAAPEPSTDATGGALTLKPRPFTLTLPPPDDYYFVREDQLETLHQGARDLSLEVALGALGGAIGFAQNLVVTVMGVVSGDLVSRSNFFGAVISLTLAVTAIVLLLQRKGRSSEIGTLVQKIKSGQRIKVSDERSPGN